jgi:hypothetical protein
METLGEFEKVIGYWIGFAIDVAIMIFLFHIASLISPIAGGILAAIFVLYAAYKFIVIAVTSLCVIFFAVLGMSL